MLIDKQYDLQRIQSAIQKAYVLTQRHERICVGISGRSDSDVMLDLLFRAVPREKMHSFISKAISHHIATLQRHGFDFRNDGDKPNIRSKRLRGE